MYEIKENSRILKDGTELTTYTRDVVSANILEVEAGTTGYQGGDAATAVAPTSGSRMQPVRIWKSAAMSTSMAAPALRSSSAATVSWRLRFGR